jgi:folate-binding protein YgfZ
MGSIERKVSPEALEALRILEGRPLYGRDITERYLPQETGQAQALHFSKGCYLGQEIVERIRSRGQVHRLLTPLTLAGELPTELPAPLEADGRPAGEITSAALVPLPEGDQILALGYVRREALDTRQTLTYSGGTAVPRSVPKPTASNSTELSSLLSDL